METRSQTGLSTISLLLATVITVASGSGAGASTIHLERDGSGDFTILQDALNAAAAGDTILIGPGRYDDFTVETFLSGGVGATIGNIHVDSLTIIGESAETVIIGPDQMMYEFQGVPAFGLVADNQEPVGWVLRGVTSEHTDIVLRLVGDSEVTDCEFRSESGSAVKMDYEAGAGRVSFRDCRFGRAANPGTNRVDALTSAITRGPGELELLNCMFSDVGFNISSVSSLLIRDVQVVDGLVTLYYDTGSILRLAVQNRRTAAIVTNSVDLTIAESEFQGGGGAVTAFFTTNSAVHCERTRFITPLEAPAGTNPKASVYLSGAAEFSAHNSDILPSADYSIAAFMVEAEVPEIDLTNNYWGTTDSLEIEDLIFDRADEGHPDYPTGYHLTRVKFWPSRGGSVPAQTRSVGGLKGRYRGSRAAKN